MRSSDVAVTGLGVRLSPDIDDAEHLWQVITHGRSVSGLTNSGPDGRRTPADGGGDAAGLRRSIDEFDPTPFGIGRAEAVDLDPQQRLVLESTWDCLADAEIGWNGLRAQSVGVFAGAYAQDWLLTQGRAGAPFSGYIGTGTAHSMLANRLSYLLDVHGPSLTVDTACSSSLTALHLAISALRRRECDLALVTAVALGFDETYRSMTTSSLPFSSRGVCRPFDAEADGIVRGEGAVTLLLELDHRRGHRRSRATLLGSAVNHDGRTNGLTAPSAWAQTRLLQAALADADVSADDVGYLEAHGTGTILGDPIEARAIAAVYAADDAPRRAPLLIGSVKGTFGHLEAAAGMAGVASAILSLQHRTVPPQTAFHRINPAIDLKGGALRIPRTAEVLPHGQLVGVSSFGFGGSNTHVVLGPATPGRASAAPESDPSALHVLTLSAADADGLQARRTLARHRVTAGTELDVLARTTRADSGQRHRYAWSAGSDAELAIALHDLAGGTATGRISSAAAAGAIWVFSGQGAQWTGMASELLQVPALQESWRRWEQEVQRATGWSLTERLAEQEHDTTTTVDQITIAAVQLALAELLSSWGHRPAAVIGHSMGEVPAAVVAGALSSAEGFEVLARRGSWIESAAAGGRMLAVALSAAEVSSSIDGRGDLSVAAVNGPQSTVVSGAADAIARLALDLAATGVATRQLPASYAFHSHLLDAIPIGDRSTATPGVTGTIAQFSTVTGRALDLARRPDHWWRNVREPVLFGDAMEAALAHTGSRCVVEIAPRPVLQQDIEAIAERALPDDRVLVLSTLRRRETLSTALGALASGLYRHGIDLNPIALSTSPRTWVSPVPYAWQRHRYWPETPARAAELAATPRRQSLAPPEADQSSGGRKVCGPDAEAFAASIREHVCDLVSQALDDRPVVSADVPLGDWELESLAVVTLRNAVERRFGVVVPLSLLLQGPTPRQLAASLADLDPAPTLFHADQGDADQGDALDHLSDAELEALLAGLEALPSVGSRPHDDSV